MARPVATCGSAYEKMTKHYVLTTYIFTHDPTSMTSNFWRIFILHHYQELWTSQTTLDMDQRQEWEESLSKFFISWKNTTITVYQMSLFTCCLWFFMFAYLIFVTGATGGAREIFFAQCKFLQIWKISVFFTDLMQKIGVFYRFNAKNWCFSV